MSNVVHFASFRHRETIGTLRFLLERAERGEIGGLQFTIDDLAAGEDVSGYIGSYREDPQRLATALDGLAQRIRGALATVCDVFRGTY